MLKIYRYAEQTKRFNEVKGTVKDKKNFFEHEYTITITTNRGKSLEIYPFTKFGFISYIQKFGETYKKCGVNAIMLGYIAQTCWQSWETFLYKKGKKIHFKRRGEMDGYKVRHMKETIPGFNMSRFGNEMIGINLNGKMRGLTKILYLPFKVNHESEYAMQALGDKIVNIAIRREVIRGKRRYFVQFTFEGQKPMKQRKLGKGDVGIDLGVSTVAICSNNNVKAFELAKNTYTRVDDMEREIRRLMRYMDRSRRAANPNNYNADGTIWKGKKTWKLSKRYFKAKDKLKELYRRQRVKRKLSHIELANELLSYGNNFKVEKNSVNGWAKKAKEDKVDPNTGKHRHEKRNGKVIANRAPAMLITILQNKVVSLGGTFTKLETKNTAGTKFDFTAENFRDKTGLGIRNVILSNGDKHTRDLMAAFNIQHLESDDKADKVSNYNIGKMWEDYPKFKQMEQDFIRSMLNSGEKIHKSMGINHREYGYLVAD